MTAWPAEVMSGSFEPRYQEDLALGGLRLLLGNPGHPVGENSCAKRPGE